MKLTVLFILLCIRFALGAPDSITATGAPGISSAWPTAKKQGFGTAYQASKVWFTVARGILTETYFPRIDRAQTRETQFLITDGKTFLHQEAVDTIHEVIRIGNAPFYKITNKDKLGRYEIIKEIWADPFSDTIIQNVIIKKMSKGLQFYLHHTPAVANSLFGDSAYSEPLMVGQEEGFGASWQGLKASNPFEKVSVGYLGKSDGMTDLKDYVMDNAFEEAPNGNVALTAKLAIPESIGETNFTLYLFFHDKKTELVKLFSIVDKIDLNESKAAFFSGWDKYIANLKLPIHSQNQKRKDLLIQSVLVLKSAEDKTYRGSIIASPSHPWGETQFEAGPNPGDNPGYHVVWPRDLYHIINALIAVDDKETSVAALERLRQTQYQEGSGDWSYPPRVHKRQGSFPQNFLVDGKPLYDGYQADETAMPVLIAYQLWKKGWVSLDIYWTMVKSAADFLSELGLWTQQERWEETYGVSPNTAAFVIAAIKAASEMAEAKGEMSLAKKWKALSEQWTSEKGLDAWTFTTEGKIKNENGDGRYYLRLSGNIYDEKQGKPLFDAPWDPNSTGYVLLANVTEGSPYRFQSDIIDGGFLSLVHLGLKKANYSLVLESLPEIDRLLKVETPKGPAWYRYRYDRYGEKQKGRLWPLLTGERMRYEILHMKELGEADILSKMEKGLSGYESFANSEGLFSEQVWDEGAEIGTPTGSATPLLWSHAEYITLSREILNATK